jgi:queuine tRNA-ribosyltransferase
LLARELNAAILVSLHNLAFYFNLMRGIREAIKSRRLTVFAQEFMARWAGEDEGEGNGEED